jgi:hypothetical protein
MQFSDGESGDEFSEELQSQFGIFHLFSHQEGFHKEGLVVVHAIFESLHDLVVEHYSIFEIAIAGSIVGIIKEFCGTEL